MSFLRKAHVALSNLRVTGHIIRSGTMDGMGQGIGKWDFIYLIIWYILVFIICSGTGFVMGQSENGIFLSLLYNMGQEMGWDRGSGNGTLGLYFGSFLIVTLRSRTGDGMGQGIGKKDLDFFCFGVFGAFFFISGTMDEMHGTGNRESGYGILFFIFGIVWSLLYVRGREWEMT